MKFDLKGHWRSQEFTLFVDFNFFLDIFFISNLILLKICTQDNNIKTQIFHNSGHIKVTFMFESQLFLEYVNTFDIFKTFSEW